MFSHKQHLFKVSASTQKTQLWLAWVEEDEVCYSFGQLDGKMQEDRYKAQPKNIGKANETTAQEQAEVELQALYKKQIENKHYFTSEIDAIEAAKVCRIPRKVYNWKDKKDTWEDKEMISTYKYNGSRACVVDGALYSKIGRKEEIKVKHLAEGIEAIKDKYPSFDAEVYAHGLSLQRIRSAWLKPHKTEKEIVKVAKDLAKKKGIEFKSKCHLEAIDFLGYNPNEDAGKLKFYVFDIPMDDNTPFKDRNSKVYALCRYAWDVLGGGEVFQNSNKLTTLNNTTRESFRNIAVKEGYEGLVHYDPNGVYEYGKRSLNTLKDKPRYDSEALVVDVEMCKNGQGKLVLQACDSLDNISFKAMMKGNKDSRAFEVQKQFIGKWVNFSYEELSGAGVPTKPVVHETRLCDEKGRPLE